MYLIKRGQSKDSIDKALENQAKKIGVKIIYNSKFKQNEADIIATGITKKPSWIASGIKFKLKRKDRIIVLLDNNLSLKAYSYFILNDNIGEITCCNPCGKKDIKKRLNLTIKRFEKILNIKIKKIEERFCAIVNLEHFYKARINNQHYVGEAAGFQDGFYGFGMVYAFKSGYLAAKSISENLDYDKLWKKDFLKQLKIASLNRRLYNKLPNDYYEKIITILNSKNPIIRKVRGGNDIRNIMKKFYNNSVSSLLNRFIFIT